MGKDASRRPSPSRLPPPIDLGQQEILGRDSPLRASELALVEGGVEYVPVPWVGNHWVCPNCEEEIPPLRVVFLGKPPKYANMLHDIIRCCWCKFNFSPRSEATVLRR